MGAQISSQNLELICHFNGEGDGEEGHYGITKDFQEKTNRRVDGEEGGLLTMFDVLSQC